MHRRIYKSTCSWILELFFNFGNSIRSFKCAPFIATTKVNLNIGTMLIWWNNETYDGRNKVAYNKTYQGRSVWFGFVFMISILYCKSIQTTRLSDFPICFDRVTYKAHSVRTSCSLQSGESMLKQTCLPFTNRCNTFKYKYKYTMARSMLLKNMSSLHLISFNITFQYKYKYNMAKGML